jgi:hypothetical protein
MIKILSIDVGIKNLSYCYIHTNEGKTQLVEWNNICVTEANCKKIKLEDLTEAMLDKLTEYFGDNREIDVVLIENQPMLKNGMMKTMSVVIYTFFNMMKLQYGNVKQVRFISATNKLKCRLSNELEDTIKTTYKDRKRLSVEIAKLYIQKMCPDKTEWFSQQKKPDDLADNMCQAIYYIENVLKYDIQSS